jgi:hypothetical protein
MEEDRLIWYAKTIFLNWHKYGNRRSADDVMSAGQVCQWGCTSCLTNIVGGFGTPE